MSDLIFEKSKKGRRNIFNKTLPKSSHKSELSHESKESYKSVLEDCPAALLRKNPPKLPEVSELDVVRHYTELSQKNFSIDTQFYPLGSCTMKYNPKIVHHLASLPAFINRHPLTHNNHSQGFLQCLYELQEILKSLTGMKGVSLTPMAGAQGELAGVLMIRAYHHDRNEDFRNEMLVPDSAHGTNPATAVMCGYKVIEVPTAKDGDLDLTILKEKINEKTAGIMLTNPSTLGLFERHIEKIAHLIHQAGGLLYYDGANLNAILGKVNPYDMGFDVMHLNTHKTFATPHGGGGPGSGPVLANENLAPYLPVPMVGFNSDEYYWIDEQDQKKSIGKLSCFMGNAGILLRAYIYLRLLGKEGIPRLSQFATLNANYLLTQLQLADFNVVYKNRRASHEFVISFKKEAKELGVNAMDFAKRLLDYNQHPPTTYFPLSIPECWLIEPTETETKETLDQFVVNLGAIKTEAEQNPTILKSAPHNLSVGRLDDVYAAKILDIAYDGT